MQIPLGTGALPFQGRVPRRLQEKSAAYQVWHICENGAFRAVLLLVLSLISSHAKKLTASCLARCAKGLIPRLRRPFCRYDVARTTAGRVCRLNPVAFPGSQCGVPRPPSVYGKSRDCNNFCPKG